MDCDRKDFSMTETIPDVEEYTKMAMTEAIHHLLKPTREDAKIGERRYKIFKILDKIFKTSLKICIVYFVWQKIQMYLI